MAEQSKVTLKSYFNTGDVPSEDEFGDLIDSFPQASVTPTLEELSASYFLLDTIDVTFAYPVWLAPFACKITWAGVMEFSGVIPASDTDYWTVLLRRIRADAVATIATKTTKTTGGEAVAQRTYWGFDGVTFDTINQICQLGDAIDFRFEKTLAPNAWMTAILCIRYEPI